ncbi:MAG TPA: hypothetical protein VEZ11_11730 [Thermoanaerobaculia bacterium]|nr:hypothetical protein [Thermoanaerobaculia bacterium]
MKLNVDSELKARVDGEANPLVFEPNVDWTGFAEANIIRAY